MSWPAKIGAGVAVLAAVAAGQAVNSTLPDTDSRPFVHSGGIRDRVHMVYADVTVNGRYIARTLDSVQGVVNTPGRWLVVDLGMVAWQRPLSRPGFTMEDGRGRVFEIDLRSGYNWDDAPTGVPWRVHIPFEVPADALPGATLVITRSADDHRRDDIARIDLGIGTEEAQALWDGAGSIELPATGMAT